VRRITAIFIGFAFVPFVAFADDMGSETIVIERDTIVIEEAVSAPPPAFVELQSTAIAAGIGARIGDGSLFVDGQEHPFKVRGVSLGDLGASVITGKGPVQGLENVSDFAGTYLAVEAGIAAGKGVSTLTMRNQHGVTIRLESDIRGAQLTLGGQALTLVFE